MRKAKIHSSNDLICQLPQAISFVNNEFEIVHASNRWISDFSSITAPPLIGHSIHDHFARLNSIWQKTLEDCLNGEPGQPRVNCYLDEDGTEKWFELVKTAWHDEDENVIGWIIQADKVSQRKQNELQLDKLQILSTEMSDIAKIGMWEYNVAQDKLHWSDMTKIIHEVPLDYVPTLEKATNFYKSGYSRNTLAMTVEKAITNEISWTKKLQLITANGNEVSVIVSGKPIYKNGVFTGLIGTIQNINSLALSEIKTKQNEYHLRTLIDNLPLNVFIKDLDSRKVLVNKSEMAYCGMTLEKDIIGKDDFAFFDEETAKKSRMDDLRVMRELKPIMGAEMEHVKVDGTKTVLLTSKIPLVQPDGSAYGLVGISMDISEIKKKEQELKALIDVTSLQNKKLLNFAHIVSHNLRSHTANFSMLLDFLTHEKKKTEKDKIIKMLTTASDNLLETLDNLNEVVDISSKTGQEKKPVNLNDKITLVEHNLSALVSEHRVKIQNNVGTEVQIKVIPAYIESILMNFITNGIKYRSPDRPPIIKLSTTKEQGYTVLSITDNGIGIDLKKYGDKLFGMYKTFHNNKDAKGIGLYITKNQIEAMNGKITVTSTVGSGTTFKIFFDEKN